MTCWKRIPAASSTTVRKYILQCDFQAKGYYCWYGTKSVDRFSLMKKNHLLRWSYTFLSHRDLSSAHKGDVFLGSSTGMVTEGVLRYLEIWMAWCTTGSFLTNTKCQRGPAGFRYTWSQQGSRPQKAVQELSQPYLGVSTCHQRVHQSQLLTGPAWQREGWKA